MGSWEQVLLFMESLLYFERARAMMALDNDGMMDDRMGTTGNTAIALLMILCLPAGDGVLEYLNSTPWPTLWCV